MNKAVSIFSRHPFFIRLFHWEYWSASLVYGPLYPYFVWLCIKAGFRYFMNASNPGIENGGFLMEQKHLIYENLPDAFYPKCFLVKAGTKGEEVETKIRDAGFAFPLILKPNIGLQGKAVQKINGKEELYHYATISTIDYLVQELSPYKREVGVFYYRLPGAEQGTITGIVAKEPMMVKGDGTSTLLQLILQEPRYRLQEKALRQMYKEAIHHVLPAGEIKILAPYGNHARGSKFLDWTNKADAILIESINRVCSQIEGFYYGRLDIMYDNWNSLQQGKEFHIIELNGAGSDPTHIFDPKHSLFFAWKEILRHWRLLFQVSAANHKRGIPYWSFREGNRIFKNNARLIQQLDTIATKL